MTLRARDLMQAEPITLAADTPFRQIQHLFVVARIGGAPVVDESGVVVGNLSATDLLRALDQTLDDEVDPGADRLDTLTARAMATPDVIWVTPEATLAEVARRMRAEGVHRVLVGERGRLVGVLTAYDLLQALPPDRS